MPSSPGNTSSPRRRDPSSRGRDRILTGILIGSALLAGVVLMILVGFVGHEATPAFSRVGLTRFFIDEGWNPAREQFNAVPMIVGTIATTLGAMLLAAPAGIACAIFLQFHAPRTVALLLRRLITVLAGIPSVVFGLWGLISVVPLVLRFGTGPGQCLLSATIVLGVMILPTIALTSDVALRAVPRSLLRGAEALGISRVRQVLRLALPSAWPGIRAGLFLAVGRALGETMAVLLVAGNVNQIPGSIFDSIRTLTGGIALQLEYAEGLHRSVLFASGLFLMLPVSVLALIAHRGARRDGSTSRGWTG